MAKRFTDTAIWEEDWFLELTTEEKLFWYYLKDACDHAGFWRINRKRFEFVLGSKFKIEGFLEKANRGKERIRVIGDRWAILSFIRFQYGDNLNLNNRVHFSIMEILKAYESSISLLDLNLTSNRPQLNPNHGVKDKDKDSGEKKEDRGVGEEEGKTIFEVFRKAYPGTKRGLDREFEDFIKKHRDWRLVVKNLIQCLKKQIEARREKESRKEFVPEWAHLKTYLFQRKWEEYQEMDNEISGDIAPNNEDGSEKPRKQIRYEQYLYRGLGNLNEKELEWVYDYQHEDRANSWKFPDDVYLIERNKLVTRKMADDYANG